MQEVSTAATVGALVVGARIRPDFRSAARRWGLWLGIEANRTSAAWEFENGKRETTRMQGSGQLGFDYYPIRFVGFGPFVGFRGDFWHIATSTFNGPGASTTPDEFNASATGPEFGLHARARTPDRPGHRAIAYADAMVFQWRVQGQNALYARAEIGVQLGGFVLAVGGERRLASFSDARNDVAPSDGADASWDAYAHSHPGLATLLVSIGFVAGGKRPRGVRRRRRYSS